MNSLTLGLVVACAAFVEDVISTGIPYWYKIGSGSGTFYYGLFMACAYTPIGSVCQKWHILPDWVMASQAMMISSVLALGASILLGIMFLTILKDKAIVCIGAAFMSFAAGLAVAGVKFTKEASGDLHAGFGLAIIAAIHAFVAGAIFFLSRNRIGQM
ncbi:uncharacterized protein LOC128230326 isoform X2 [Mya arenaria]|uniref:uncharacterized protein LOC128230326 isoform X2 n=1 Tax=Mya arenaria TaxID=6604 RepID=UPI0022E16250|nr:uncharacterized protein LOC128230326 isoform X2 [Mya arenaria]